MATVQSVITSARYDLRDYGKGLIFDNAELVDYLNRMVGLMDSQLAALKSDLVEAEDSSLSTTEDQNYVDLSALNSDLWDSLRSVWLYDDTNYTELEKISMESLRMKRLYSSGESAKPQFYAISNRYLMFEVPADDTYTCYIYYNKKTDTLTLSDNMPYNGIFDELFREMLVGHAKAKKEGRMLNTDAYFRNLFNSRALQENIRRSFIPPTYHKDF